jgi:hypothetical protein
MEKLMMADFGMNIKMFKYVGVRNCLYYHDADIGLVGCSSSRTVGYSVYVSISGLIEGEISI